MRLPNAERSLVAVEKVAGYLLSEAHPLGRFKSAVFRNLGYASSDWDVLAVDLRRHAMANEAMATEANPYGQKYEVRGSLKGPSGRAIVLVTVWIVLHGEDFPRFVTAFPGRNP